MIIFNRLNQVLKLGENTLLVDSYCMHTQIRFKSLLTALIKLGGFTQCLDACLKIYSLERR